MEEKNSPFNKWWWDNWTSAHKRNLDTDFASFTKINSKRIRDLNVKHETIKLQEDNTGENLDDL